MKRNKLKNILSTFAVSMIITSIVAACSSSTGSNMADNNNNLNNALVIEKAAMIPVIDGKAGSTGIYIHNTSNQTINKISYGLVRSDNKTSSLTFNQTSCKSIAANSSCLLPLTTPALAAGNSGSSILIANYNNQQSKQLLNYRYIKSSDYRGVNFSDNSQSLFGTNDYATVYVFVGNSQAQNNVGFENSNNSLAISNGLTNGKVNIPANTLIPLEIHSNQNVTANLVTITPHTVTSSKNLNKALNDAQQNNSQLQVTITPTMQANLLMNDLPVLSQSESTATLSIVNNGNQSASGINLSAGDNSITVGNATTNPCTGTLGIGASCNYQISLNNHNSNGNTLLTLNYNNSLTSTNTNQIVYYLNNNAEPMVAVVPSQSSFTEQINTNQNITFNLTNVGNVPLNSLIPKINKTLTNTTVTVQNNTCGNSLEANGNCQIQLNVAASGLIDNGIIYLNISGTYTGTSTKSYSFMSKPVYTTITDPLAPTVTSTTPQDTATGVSKATGIIINFSEPMTPTTLTNSNIKLQKVSDSSNIPLTSQGVTNNNQTVSFSTGSNLSDLTQYRIVINPSQIQDINGNAMSAATSQTVSTFTTADNTPPTINNFTPANGASNQSQSPSITLTFSKAMDESTLTTSNIILQTQAGTSVTGTSISYNSTTYVATVNLSNSLDSQTTYLLLINQNNLKDSSGNAMGSNSSYQVTQFTIGDFTAPTLSSTVPVNGATTVAVESPISLTFSEAMDTSTLNSTNIQLQKVSDSSNISLNAPSYSNGDKTVTFQPSANLIADESYNIIINPSAIKDVTGNVMNATISQTIVSNFIISSGAPTPNAIIKVTTVGKSGFFSGSNGGQDLSRALAFPYNVESTASATVTLTYRNTGSSIATNFTTTFNPLPPGWVLTTHNCNNFTLQASPVTTCSDTYTFSSFAANSTLLKQVNGVYSTNINANDIKQSWDEGNNHFVNQATVLPAAYLNQIIYVNYFLKIFVSNSTTTGQLSTITGGNNAISNADAICANDSNRPADGYTYKAMLVTSTDNIVTPTPDKDRYVCKSANCVDGGEQSFDWVLLPESVNYRTVGSTSNTTSIGTTAANYGYLLNSNAFSTVAYNVWTGFSLIYNSWMSAPYNSTDATAGGSCNNWTSASNTLYGTYGTANGSGYNGPIASAVSTCDSASHHLYCVQQVAPKQIFVTNTTTDGNIVATSGKSAAAAADAICNTDTARPNSGAYKALLVTATRYNNGSGTNSDWPLTASTSYYNMSGALAFTTNTYGIPPDSFMAAIYPNSAMQAWTGAGVPDDSTINWNYTSAENYCNNWTDAGSGMEKAMIGATGATDANVWNYNGGDTCTTSSRLYCVQQ
ncbi:MAG: DUF1554 domain-containing protein [Neisseriaceae bacterium]|nr:MAG: DUF1554 domain-containing protein [Neisseriaceae bacterium]